MTHIKSTQGSIWHARKCQGGQYVSFNKKKRWPQIYMINLTNIGQKYHIWKLPIKNLPRKFFKLFSNDNHTVITKYLTYLSTHISFIFSHFLGIIKDTLIIPILPKEGAMSRNQHSYVDNYQYPTNHLVGKSLKYNINGCVFCYQL